MNLIYIILIAISLSMDAFSLSLSIGTMSFSLKRTIMLSIIVGIFHFFMPMIGYILGMTFVSHFNINLKFFSGIIFIYIGIQMFKDFISKEEETIKMDIAGFLLFALGVSLDSFGIGFVLTQELNEILFSSMIFALFSASFTFLGLMLGKVMKKIIGDFAILFGASIMMILAIINFVNFYLF